MSFLAIVKSDYDNPPMIWYLKGETLESAVKEFRTEIIGEWYEDDEYIGYDGGQIQAASDLNVILEITLYEVSSEFKMPFKQWFDEAQKRTEQAKVQFGEQAEKAEFKRLRAKFGG